MSKLTKEDKKRIAQLYIEDGMSARTIAARYRVTHQAIDYTLRRQGVKARHPIDAELIGKTIENFRVLGKTRKYTFQCQCVKCGYKRQWYPSALQNPEKLYCAGCRRLERRAALDPVVVGLYNEGLTMKQVCAELCRKGLLKSASNGMYVGEILRRNNVRIRPKGFQKGEKHFRKARNAA